MNLVFMGTPEYATASLKAIIDSGHKLLGVVTQPDKPKGRGYKMKSPPVKALAVKSKIPIYQPKNVKDNGFISKLAVISPDIIVVAAYGQILPEELIKLPLQGCINVHASLLPKLRGAAPIHGSIIQGMLKTGITIMQMDTGMDTGDIISQRELNISSRDTAGSLHDKLADLGAELLVETLDNIEKGDVKRTPQNELEATYAPKLKKQDGLIDWNMTEVEIDRFVRGLYPWPVAFTYLNSRLIKIMEVFPISNEKHENALPGQVVSLKTSKGGFLVQTGEGCVLITRVQPEGKNEITGADFVRGYHLKIGECFKNREG